MAESKNVLLATDANFQSDVEKSPQLAMVDLWAPWCGPCLRLGPKVEKIADDFAGKMKVFKLNVDENAETPTRYGVRGIPTVLFFKDGKFLDSFSGDKPAEEIVAFIQKLL